MEELLLSFRILLAIIFISSAISKLKDINGHGALIAEYKITPINWSNPLAWINCIFELLAGILLFIGYFQSPSLIVIIIFLVGYSFAVGINLVRGRSEMSCGCGGVVGDNPISWFLVIRNIFFAGLAVGIYYNRSPIFNLDLLYENIEVTNVFRIEGAFVILATIILALMYWAIVKIYYLKKSVDEISI